MPSLAATEPATTPGEPSLPSSPFRLRRPTGTIVARERGDAGRGRRGRRRGRRSGPGHRVGARGQPGFGPPGPGVPGALDGVRCAAHAGAPPGLPVLFRGSGHGRARGRAGRPWLSPHVETPFARSRADVPAVGDHGRCCGLARPARLHTASIRLHHGGDETPVAASASPPNLPAGSPSPRPPWSPRGLSDGAALLLGSLPMPEDAPRKSKPVEIYVGAEPVKLGRCCSPWSSRIVATRWRTTGGTNGTTSMPAAWSVPTTSPVAASSPRPS